MRILLALSVLLAVIGGGNDGLEMLGLRHMEPAKREEVRGLWHHEKAEEVDGTPDSIYGRFDIPLRVAGVAGTGLVAGNNDDEGDDAGRSSRSPRTDEEAHGEAPPEGGIDGLWRITIWACTGDETGRYCPGDITASGVPLAEFDSSGRRMAACSGHWPFRTAFSVGEEMERMEVVCLDRGGMVTARNHLDIYFLDAGNPANPDEGTGWWWLQRVGDRAIVEVSE